MKELGVTDLRVLEDDRGSLYEVIHSYDIGQFGQVYKVASRKSGTIRAFHRHKELWDWFSIDKGSAKFVIGVDEGDRVSIQNGLKPFAIVGKTSLYEFVLNGDRPKVLTVPPLCWHGWMALEDDTRLLSIASHVYRKEKPDEERISPYHYDEPVCVWSIKMK